VGVRGAALAPLYLMGSCSPSATRSAACRFREEAGETRWEGARAGLSEFSWRSSLAAGSTGQGLTTVGLGSP
jgi:hypothetical protein